ncbi:CGP-CTERM sorting domain-containing protein [Thermococcus sp. Bubb.Bath]|uniref:CGP-CTERM sorting domain-containing protein n=1 Tax=Thermococcus sp. Bubb.Bath TaxID=1638242 RepID=UPI00143A4840|nr:CGP-CTERM sorting domain-containing protein [Thermococcus sp. Bubb.Bath]NJF24294.1 CGP-CTERM sorting domain-containing protein [Thermococcus sp. Bubb.Bath]
MRRVLSLASTIFVFLLMMFLPLAGAFNVLEHLDQNQTYLGISIRGNAIARNGTPPTNPFNDTSIQGLYIILPHNKTHVWFISYSPKGTKTEKPDWYYPRTPRIPFNLSDWNLSKVIKEYQWGVENYLPNVTGNFSIGEWRKGYWNSSIGSWEVEVNAHNLTITLHTIACEGSLECDEYITFKCWRNESNVTCQWGKPVFKTIAPPWGPKTTTSEATSKTTTTSTTTSSLSAQTTTTPETTSKTGSKICGPGVLIGLVLAPILLTKRTKR